MAEGKYEDNDRKICARLTRMLSYIQTVDRKINHLISMEDALEKKGKGSNEFKSEIHTMKQNHDLFKKNFTRLADSFEIGDESSVINSKIDAFKNQEDETNNRINELAHEMAQLAVLFLRDDNKAAEVQRKSEQDYQSAEPSTPNPISNDAESSFKMTEQNVRMRFFENVKELSSSDDQGQDDHEDQAERISTNIEGLEEQLRDLSIQADKRSLAESVGENDVTIMGGDENTGDIERDTENEDDGKINMMEWLKMCTTANEDYKAMNKMRIWAVDIGIHLSQLLTEFMILMSKNEDITSRLWELKSSLEGEIVKDAVNVVTFGKIISVMEMVEITYENELKKMGSFLYEQSQVEEVMIKLFGEIMNLESILSCKGLPDSPELTEDDFSTIEKALWLCEKEVQAMEGKMNEWKKSCSYDFESEEFKDFELMMNEVWNEMKSEEFKG